LSLTFFGPAETQHKHKVAPVPRYQIIQKAYM